MKKLAQQMIHMGRGGEEWGLVGVNRPAEKRSN